MPRTKQKPAQPVAAPPIQPERQPTPTELRQARAKRQFEALRDFAEVIYNDTDTHDFALLKTFKLIIDRNRGCNTPIEEFITSLVLMYGLRDDDGRGLTLKDIQFEMEQHITDDRTMERAIEDAHYMASRYPLPEPQKAEAPEQTSNQ